VPVLPPLSRFRRARCLGEFPLHIRNSRRASTYPLPSDSLYLRSPDLHRATGVPLSSTRDLVVSLPPFMGPGVLSRGNQPSPAPNFPFPALECAQLLTRARLRRRRAIPSWAATFRGLCVVAIPTPVFATFPRTSLSPSRRPGAPSARSSPVNLRRGRERCHRCRPGRPVRASF
jgi:hypothetical protein